MLFVFPPLIQAGIAAGQYEVVKNAAGVALGIARNKATGRFVGHAMGILDGGGIPLNPISVPLQIMHMYQTQQGFRAVQMGLQSIQTSLGVLQTMTTLTGIGVAANLAISAVSLWQILKLREDVKQQRLEIREGFLDLKQIISDQGAEALQKIDDAVQHIEFKQHCQILAQAYGRFQEASRTIKIACSCEDLNIRNADLANARQTLTEALADYKNPQILMSADAITQLRRFECVWAIEQTIAITYQLQNQTEALRSCLSHLQERICQDMLAVLDVCESSEELEVIFPETIRIYEHDLVILKLWQEQIDWMQSLSPSAMQQLQEANNSQPEEAESSTVTNIEIPPEQSLYEDNKQKSHFSALRDALHLMIRSETREKYEVYISQQAKSAGRKTLVLENLRQMSNLSVANLYWYFQLRDDSESNLATENV